jgi:hypothetical protein
VTLRLLTDVLDEARRILERGEATGRIAHATRAAHGRDHTGCAEYAADRERAEPATPVATVHATIIEWPPK